MDLWPASGLRALVQALLMTWRARRVWASRLAAPAAALDLTAVSVPRLEGLLADEGANRGPRRGQ